MKERRFAVVSKYLPKGVADLYAKSSHVLTGVQCCHVRKGRRNEVVCLGLLIHNDLE